VAPWPVDGQRDLGRVAEAVDIPLDAYSQAEHLFLFHDPDKRARERFAEIGGVDPYLVQEAVLRLGRHQALYIRRDGPAICVVDALRM
jgi:hypothetical protein